MCLCICVGVHTCMLEDDNLNLGLNLHYLGKVILLKDHEVCKQGDILSPEQARILVSCIILGALTLFQKYSTARSASPQYQKPWT